MSSEFSSENEYILLARVLYVANLMDQPNDSNDSALVAEFVRTGVEPDCAVFGVLTCLHTASTMVHYLRMVWLDKEDFVWTMDEDRLRELTDALRKKLGS